MKYEDFLSKQEDLGWLSQFADPELTTMAWFDNQMVLLGISVIPGALSHEGRIAAAKAHGIDTDKLAYMVWIVHPKFAVDTYTMIPKGGGAWFELALTSPCYIMDREGVVVRK